MTSPINNSSLNPSPETTDTWENRIQNAAVFMGLSTQVVEEGLKTLGVEKDQSGLEMLSDESITPFGDIRSVFCDNTKIPIAKVRMAMKYLRGPNGSNKTDTIDPELVALKNKYGIKMRLEDVDISELLQFYHPDKTNHISIALKKKYGDKPIIVFKPESNIIDIEATANYSADLEQGFPEQDSVEVDGCLVRIYPIGKMPNQTIEEDPLFEGRPLKRGRSMVNRINWSDIGYPIRQFCRIIVERGDIDVNDRFQVKELLQFATVLNLQKSKATELRKVYPEADLEYRERSQKDCLPRLLMQIDDIKERKQNPFGINNRIY